MSQHRQNAKWLRHFAPFRTLSISSAYLAPFFLGQGMNQTQIFALQSIFSLAYVLWELPSGYVADRFGRARCMKISAPIAAVAMIGYGFSHQFWQFAALELLLAISNGLISGVDTALLYDSLKADGEEEDFVRLSQRIVSFAHGGTALGVPVAMLLVANFGVRSTLIADGVLLIFGTAIAWRLVDAPKSAPDPELEPISAFKASRALLRNIEARWLIAFGAVLATSTYLAAWLSAPYYQSVGVPLIYFSAILAVRSLFKAVLAHRIHSENHLSLRMFSFALLAGLVYVAMSSGLVWLIWIVLGHDSIQALQDPPMDKRLNRHITSELRATLNSVGGLVRRLVYAVTGPLAGLLIDTVGLQTGLRLIGLIAGSSALLVYWRLTRLKTFQ